MGKYGENPRDKLPHEAETMSNQLHEMSIGTTKTTNHIPGYNGFLPKSDFNAEAMR